MTLRTYRVIDTIENVVIEEFSHTELVRSPAHADFVRFDIVDITDLSDAQTNGVYHGRRRISRLDFMRLFSHAERIAIRTAAQQSAELEDFLDLLDKADQVHLDSAETIAGLAAMEQGGLLATGRADEVRNG